MRKFVHNCNLKARSMPLNRSQISALKGTLRRASELIADAQAIADAAKDHSKVASLKQLRRNVADEIAELAKNG